MTFHSVRASLFKDLNVFSFRKNIGECLLKSILFSKSFPDEVRIERNVFINIQTFLQIGFHTVFLLLDILCLYLFTFLYRMNGIQWLVKEPIPPFVLESRLPISPPLTITFFCKKLLLKIPKNKSIQKRGQMKNVFFYVLVYR